MSEKPSKKILDIGIGKGGEYIKRDPKSVLRIGLDFRMSALSNKENDIPLVRADASGEVKLPFESNAFDHIDILFPQDELLIGLCKSNFLWKQLRRLLKEKGDMTIITERPWAGQTLVIANKRYTIIEEPQNKIMALGQENGFLIDKLILEEPEVREYGTHFAKLFADDEPGITTVYKLQARKNIPHSP